MTFYVITEDEIINMDKDGNWFQPDWLKDIEREYPDNKPVPKPDLFKWVFIN